MLHGTESIQTQTQDHSHTYTIQSRRPIYWLMVPAIAPPLRRRRMRYEREIVLFSTIKTHAMAPYHSYQRPVQWKAR